MLTLNQQIIVHIKSLRVLSNISVGRYFFRISLWHEEKGKKMFAIPFQIIEKQQPTSNNRSEVDDNYYVTKAIPFSSYGQMDVSELCVFKNVLPVFSEEGDHNDTQISILCELIHVQIKCQKIISNFKGTFKGSTTHSYFEMDFYQLGACQLTLSIHSCPFKYEFKDPQNMMSLDLKTYCQQYIKTQENKVLDYLKDQANKVYKIWSERMSLISQKEIEIKCKDIKQIKGKDSAQKQTQETEIFQDNQKYIFADLFKQQQQPEKKKRKKIFNMQSKKSQEDKVVFNKYNDYENVFQDSTVKIYKIWSDFKRIIFQDYFKLFMQQSSFSYKHKLKEKVGESITRFKGSFDTDIYHDEELLRNKLAHQLRNHSHTHNSIDNDQLQIINDDFFSQTRPILFEEVSGQIIEKVLPSKLEQQLLVILVHGLGATRLDMQKIKIELKRCYRNRITVYTSTSNESHTAGEIQGMGTRLAKQIQKQINKYKSSKLKVCLMGHSMGGVIIRTALPKLEEYKKYFYSFVSLSSPHIGYSYSTSKLVDAGLWVLNAMKKCTSILQLTMQEQQNLEDTFLYKLSEKSGLEWFEKITLVASHQDLYVPYSSARIQKNESSNIDNKNNVKRGMVYNKMIDNILEKVKGKVHRIDVNFCIQQQNIDNLIGRAAHISFLNNVSMLRTMVLGGQHYFF